MVTCTLDCDDQLARPRLPISTEIKLPVEIDLPSTASTTPAEINPITTDQDVQEESTTPTEPRSALHREICDEYQDPLPPYIGLPRWMPGTLLISELLRADWGCDPPVITGATTFKRPPYFEKGLPAPVWTVPTRFGMPAPVPLPVPRKRRFAMPPPVNLDEIEERPQFKPTVSQIRWLQSALTLGNFDPGPIDGTIGGQTDLALERWRDARLKGNVIGGLTKPEFDQIILEFGHLFDQVEPNASLY